MPGQCPHVTMIPPEVTIMLAITIFATIIGDMLPVTDSTPLIGARPSTSGDGARGARGAIVVNSVYDAEVAGG